MHGVPLSLGFKLVLGWRGQVQQGALPEPAPDLYGFLSAAGFAYLEFGTGSCRDPAERALLRREADACAEAGLGVALHPYLWGAENPACYGRSPHVPAALDAMLAAAQEVASVTGRPARLVIHPAAQSYDPSSTSPAELRRTLLERSRHFLQALREQARARCPDVRPAAEHQVPPAPGECVIRIGDTAQELLDVASGLGICWDTGHYLLSVERHGQSAVPSGEMLRRTEAVHLHDVVDGRDHRLISAESTRLRDYLQMLRAVGFGGGITLEYSVDAIRRAGGIERAASDSVRVLSDWLGGDIPA